MGDDIYQLHAEMCKVFSNPIRIKLLNLLRDGKEHSVSELQKATGLGQANLSQHLGIMRHKGAVLPKRKGRQILYRISDKKIIVAFDIIRSVLSKNLKSRQRMLKNEVL